MKTTLDIDETVMDELGREAARQGGTMSKLVETALRDLFQSQKKLSALAPLPSFSGGGGCDSTLCGLWLRFGERGKRDYGDDETE